MSRARLEVYLQDAAGNIAANYAATVYETDGTTLLLQSMYANPSGGSALTQPLASNADGYIIVYCDSPQRATIKPAGSSAAIPVDILSDPASQTLTGTITARPAAVTGSTNPVTTNTSVAALADPTLTVTTTVTSDIYVWVVGTVSDATGGAIVNYWVRVNGGSWQIIGHNAQTTGGQEQISGFHKFPSVAAGTNLIEIGNGSSVGFSITHTGSTRRIMGYAVTI